MYADEICLYKKSIVVFGCNQGRKDGCDKGKHDNQYSDRLGASVQQYQKPGFFKLSIRDIKLCTREKPGFLPPF
ncbi:hypothetical protein WA1_16785 [Scytonema hofmannii PCC 7110]|uniref:Uncharacterized protein n=1 Tax=Scytonema hofmannii PCC 7110 TaxID=128403 RepID=A0A139XAG4_9CYAN|nr:hypothetical protein [Scytonema hofmannii]KYC41694.1 hypothetical protein WA1_16785 [Scytonema hofmannii PCC 7110]